MQAFERILFRERLVNPEEPQQNKLNAAGPAFAAKLFAKTHLHDLQHAPNMCFESELQSKSMPATPCRMHKVSFDLRSLAAQGPDSTGVGDRPGRP
jgi:hypothetical protein